MDIGLTSRAVLRMCSAHGHRPSPGAATAAEPWTYFIARGFTGDPTAPVKGSGWADSKNS
jgi:hypothetical protein